MKIGPSIENLPAAEPALRGGARSPAGVAGTAAAGTARAQDKVAVSAAGAQMGALDAAQDFDSAKVDAIRQAMREGRFSVNPGAIADRLIADASALLGPRSA